MASGTSFWCSKWTAIGSNTVVLVIFATYGSEDRKRLIQFVVNYSCNYWRCMHTTESMACQPARTEAYDEDLRWRMVYQYYALELTYCKIASNLNVDPSTVQRVVQRFKQSGTVTKDVYPKGHNHPSQILTEVNELLVIYLVLDRPIVFTFARYSRSLLRQLGQRFLCPHYATSCTKMASPGRNSAKWLCKEAKRLENFLEVQFQSISHQCLFSLMRMAPIGEMPCVGLAIACEVNQQGPTSC